MRLLTAHKVTIGTSMAGCLAFAVWGFNEYRTTGALLPLVLAPAALVLCLFLGMYLRNFARKHRRPAAPPRS